MDAADFEPILTTVCMCVCVCGEIVKNVNICVTMHRKIRYNANPFFSSRLHCCQHLVIKLSKFYSCSFNHS